MPPISLSYIKEKWQHAGFQKYLKNTGWMFGGRFISLTISFFVGVYIARYLGPANYGLLNYVISFVGLFGFLASFGIDGIISREIIKDHNKKDELIGAGFYIKIIGSLLAIASVFTVSLFTTRDIFTLGLIWIFSLTFIPQAFNIVEIYFQSQVLSKKIVTAQITSNIASAILKLSVIFLNKGIFWLTLIYIVEASIYGVILLFNYRKFGNHIRSWKFNKNIAKSILKDSWPLMLSSVAVGLYMKIDQVMIKNILGNEQAGIYTAAVKLSEVWYFIPSLICLSTFPALINAKKDNEQLYNIRLLRLYRLIFWISFIIALPIALLSKHIIFVLFGNAYIQASAALSIYVWAGISISLNLVLGNHILTENKTKFFLFSTTAGAISNILLNIILIPMYGIAGAASATFLSYIVVILSVVFFKDLRPQLKIMLKSIYNTK